MPARQPFTLLCQAASRPPHAGRADLHIHTTYSDGSYTPAEVVDLARRSGLAALAVTDHDTLDGVPAMQAAAAATAAATGFEIEIIPGVEITAEHAGKEVHLLGYFVRPNDPALAAALDRLGKHRVSRFWDMVERLKDCGVSIDEQDVQEHAKNGTLGRRHLAMLMVKNQQAGSVREAFQRYLGDNGRAVAPKLRLPVAEAIALVRGAGGVASWAHPAYHGNGDLADLRAQGLQAVEAYYPTFKNSRIRQLRAWAAEHDLAVTGGSDCHGPGRELGACSITAEELAALRARCD